MTALWASLILCAGLIAGAELVLLRRYRRLLILDPQRRRILLRHMWPEAQQGAPPAPVAASPQSPARSGEAILYLDPEGHCTAANPAARDLLRWTSGDITLGDVLPGGGAEARTLLASLAQKGVVERYEAGPHGPSSSPLHINAIALRDRDNNFWGAALFIQRPAVTSEALAATPSRRRSSTAPPRAANGSP